MPGYAAGAELLLNIVTSVSVLMLVALGLAIVFGLMNIVNMAHGELVTVGAFTVSFVQARAHHPAAVLAHGQKQWRQTEAAPGGLQLVSTQSSGTRVA